MPTQKIVSLDKNGYIKVFEKTPVIKQSEIFEGYKDDKKTKKTKKKKVAPKGYHYMPNGKLMKDSDMKKKKTKKKNY